MPLASQSATTANDRAARLSLGPSDRVGTWDLVRLLGEGRLSRVFAARPLGSPLDQPACYAIKVLRSEWQDDQRGVALLAREALASRKVSNPHLVPILAAQLREPPYYLAMPRLDGCTVAERLSQPLPLDVPLAAWIGRQVAEALDALHEAQWMHCDVKPANVFLSPTGHATLVDLGFACPSGQAAAIADRPIMGTMNYMAPEVLCSTAGGDIRSDVYSLGVTLFEMLTGRLPFDAEDVAELATQHRQELPGDVRNLAPHVPTRAARLVHQMLAKDPLRRPLPRDLVNRLAAIEIETFAERLTLA